MKILNFIKITVFFIFPFIFYSFSQAAPPNSPYNPGETLDPACKPGEANCFVSFLWQSTSSGIYLKDGMVSIGNDNPTSRLTVSIGAVNFAQIGIYEAQSYRNYFQDSERAGRVRIGAVNGVPGIFSQEIDRDLFVGVNPLRKIFFGSSATSSPDAWIEGQTGNAYFKGRVKLGNLVNIIPDPSPPVGDYSSKRYVGFFGSEGLRIRHFNYFQDGIYNDALIIEKTDDDSTVEGGMIFGFSTSRGSDIEENDERWATNFLPVMTLRQDRDGKGKIGIGTDYPDWTLDVKGMINSSFDGISTKVVDGPINDSVFIGEPHNGLLAIDSKNGRLYFKANNVWHYIAKTGGFQIPAEEAQDLKINDLVIGKIDSEMSDGAKHGLWVKLTDALTNLFENTLIKFKEIVAGKVTTNEICSLDGRCIKVDEILIRSGGNLNSLFINSNFSENSSKIDNNSESNKNDSFSTSDGENKEDNENLLKTDNQNLSTSSQSSNNQTSSNSN